MQKDTKTRRRLNMNFMIKILALTQACLGSLSSLPDSENPDEFRNEVIRFVSHCAENGIDIGGPDKLEQEARIKNDQRDWEVALSEMIGNPKEFGFRTSSVAFFVARLRETQSNPMVVESVIGYFDEIVDKIDSEVASALQSGDDVPGSVYYRMGGMIPYFLEVDSTALLTRVLGFIVSESAVKVGALEEHAPIHIAAALRQKGRGEHIGDATRLADLLEGRGRADLATDIRQSVARMRDRTPPTGRTESGTIRTERRSVIEGGHRDGPGETESEGNSSRSAIAWTVGAIAVGLLSWAYVVVRRSKA